MRMKMFGGAMVMSVGLVMSVVACPPNAKTADGAKTPCSKAVQAADVKAPCGKSALTVADKVKDGQSGAKHAGCGKNCTKPCCKKKGAKTVSGKTVSDKSPCSKGCGKGVKTVSGKSPCSKGCGKGAKTASADGGCPIAKKVNAVLASLPTMKYRVGEEVTSCSKRAAAMAEKTGKPVEYVVGDEVLAKEGDAIVKLTALLEKQAEALETIQFVAGGKCGRCPVTAKSIAEKTGTKVTYRVGGVDFEKKEDAEKVVKLVSDAASEIKMVYKVDGKTFGCSKAAGAKCKKTGAKMTYVIGDEETGCKTSAALLKVKAKVRKIVETAAAASFSL